MKKIFVMALVLLMALTAHCFASEVQDTDDANNVPDVTAEAAALRPHQVRIGEHVHRALSCRSPDSLASFMPLPGCDRNIGRSYPCDEDPDLLARPGVFDRGDAPEVVVPAGNYLMIGDNRDNSEDGRYWSRDGRTWGFVPEENLVGSARRVWFNFDWDRTGWRKIDWGRIGQRID